VNIKNHNSKIDLPPSVSDFAVDVIANYDKQRVRSAYDPGCITDLLDRIPVLLVNEATQKEVEGNSDLLGSIRRMLRSSGLADPRSDSVLSALRNTRVIRIVTLCTS
jgi:hypothetical protein